METAKNKILKELEILKDTGDIPSYFEANYKILYEENCINFYISMSPEKAKDYGYILCGDENLEIEDFEKDFNYDQNSQIYTLTYRKIIPNIYVVHNQEWE